MLSEDQGTCWYQAYETSHSPWRQLGLLPLWVLALLVDQYPLQCQNHPTHQHCHHVPNRTQHTLSPCVMQYQQVLYAHISPHVMGYHHMSCNNNLCYIHVCTHITMYTYHHVHISPHVMGYHHVLWDIIMHYGIEDGR